jgi:hypothetical protein
MKKLLLNHPYFSSLSPEESELMLEESPFINSIYNGLKPVIEKIIPMISPTEKNLMEILERVNMIDFDPLLKRERKSFQIFFQISVFGRRILTELRFDPCQIPPRMRITQTEKAFIDLKRSMQSILRRID